MHSHNLFTVFKLLLTVSNILACDFSTLFSVYENSVFVLSPTINMLMQILHDTQQNAD